MSPLQDGFKRDSVGHDSVRQKGNAIGGCDDHDGKGPIGYHSSNINHLGSVDEEQLPIKSARMIALSNEFESEHPLLPHQRAGVPRSSSNSPCDLSHNDSIVRLEHMLQAEQDDEATDYEDSDSGGNEDGDGDDRGDGDHNDSAGGFMQPHVHGDGGDSTDYENEDDAPFEPYPLHVDNHANGLHQPPVNMFAGTDGVNTLQPGVRPPQSTDGYPDHLANDSEGGTVLFFL
jgi:hypothetical protein